MCECGCGDFQPRAKFPAPNGEWYALEIYPGCEDCRIGPGVVIHRMSAEEAKRWDVPELPDLPFREYGFPEARDAADSAVTILDPAKLEKEIEPDEEGMIGADEVSYATIRSAVFATLGNWPEREQEESSNEQEESSND